MQKVLALFANPRYSSQLWLGEEDRTIRECFRRGRMCDTIELVVRHAATVDDVRRALLDDEFAIVHFSGHGTQSGLVFEDRDGGQYVPPQDALADLLAEYAPPLTCAVFNACYSLTQGDLSHTTGTAKSCPGDRRHGQRHRERARPDTRSRRSSIRPSTPAGIAGRAGLTYGSLLSDLVILVSESRG